MLYLIILTFSRDLCYFSQAKTVILHLESVGESIHAFLANEIDCSAPLSLYPSTAARSAWKSFIFRESARRTLLAMFHCITICRLHYGSPTGCGHHLMAGNRITFQRALWEADSAFDFAMAWNKKNHFLIEELDFDKFLKNGTASDVDVFGKMILTGLMGMDELKGWIHTRRILPH